MPNASTAAVVRYILRLLETAVAMIFPLREAGDSARWLTKSQRNGTSFRHLLSCCHSSKKAPVGVIFRGNGFCGFNHWAKQVGKHAGVIRGTSDWRARPCTLARF